jgi:NitT/TauT family transport system permease protein
MASIASTQTAGLLIASKPRFGVLRGAGAKVLLAQILLGIVALLLWEIAAIYWIGSFWISQPSLVASRLWKLALDGELLRHSWTTAWQAIAGLLLALVVGVPLGLTLAANRFIDAVVQPYLLGLYSLPRVALAPLFILWFGIGSASKILMVFSMVIFVIILNVYEGVRNIDRDLLDMARAMRASQRAIITKIVLPAVSSWIFSAVRIGIGLALIGSVLAELLGSNKGLGWYIEKSAARIDITGVFTGLFILMVLSMALNEIIKRAESFVLRGRS